jgi:acyl transferase domain-containing protein/NAD(P)-dependent dehydrogenase (short-subunit alcohol dehydrogenase family)/acyl-CoA thioesterase FadM
MPYFVIPFRVQFQDTMAYGTHHFLTNFKFQCAAREEFIFGEVIKGEPQLIAAFNEVMLVTQQAYSRNLAPVAVGETVGILMSYEDPTPSSVRLCFRVVRRDGTPVSCGFQTIVCLCPKTHAPVAPPQALVRYYSLLREPLEKPSFLDRILAGQLREIFDHESVSLGKAVAAEPDHRHRLTADVALDVEQRRVSELSPKLDRGLVLLLPGQGSHHLGLFTQLRQISPKAALTLRRVDEIARSMLGAPFSDLVNATTAAAQEDVLRHHPDLTQLSIYTAGVVSGRCLIDAGLKPDLVVGHSAGELAALALGGAYSIELGVEIVCHRIAALQAVANVGGMVALDCNAQRAGALLEALGATNLEVAVLNHLSQTVVSGIQSDLERLCQLASHVGVACQRLQSRYPFHSQLLRPAVGRFASSLGDLRLTAPTIPVYSPIDRSLYAGGDLLSSVLPSHFMRHLAFFEAMEQLYAAGARTFVECGGGDVLTRLIRRIFNDKHDVRGFSTLPAGRLARPTIDNVLTALLDAPGATAGIIADAAANQPACSREDDIPVAIVALGCVLPESTDPEGLWRNVLEGRSGIRDGANLAPEYAQAFLSPGEIVPDKTYTLLGGLLDQAVAGELPECIRELAEASSSARILAAATMQCLKSIAHRPDPKRTHFFVGSTADGTLEYDEALVIERLLSLSRSLELPTAARAEFQDALRSVFAHRSDSAWRLAPHSSIKEVAEGLLGVGVKVLAVDAACASSLYALGLAASALRDRECDVAFAGGVFAAGPASSCLFSQFRGLSPTGSRPFDSGADGVVFCSGSALAICKRLPDALRDGDRILALLRGIGISSDGRSPSVTEPKKVGQVLAMRRAYAASGIDPASVDYVEAHATSTPVGDAVEFEALSEIFGARSQDDPPIVLGSVKALIGHTGWAAGAASLVKVCHALIEEQLPPQANFTAPNPNISLASSPFTLLQSAQPWPRGPQPRRAGINGFGFGGTNAHLIVEEFSKTWQYANPSSPSSAGELAIIGVGAVFPWVHEEQRLCFSSDELRLPSGRPILPEVQEHMDRAQFLALIAADKALRDVGDRWQTMRDDIGAVLSHQGKTARSLEATVRIYSDLVQARLAVARPTSSLSEQEFERCEEALLSAVRDTPPSNAYSLPGSMPNVVAGRIANYFDLHGPNFVIDAGSSSLLEALRVAERMLRHRECKVVLAGGISTAAHAETHLPAGPGTARRPFGEAALVLAMVMPETARSEFMNVRAIISFDSAADSIRAGEMAPANLLGAEGAWEVACSIDRVWDCAPSIEWSGVADGPRGVRFSAMADKGIVTANIGPAGIIRTTAPQLERIAPCSADRSLLSMKRLLVLVDRAPPAGLLSEITHTLICPSGVGVEGAIPVNLSSDETAVHSLRQLDGKGFDVIVALADLSSTDNDYVLSEGAKGYGLLELLFVVARWAYPLLRTGSCAITALALSAWRGHGLDPYTGLLGGFLKSLARELRDCTCRAVFTTDPPTIALSQLESELGEGNASPIEVAYRRGARYALHLKELPAGSYASTPLLERESVVVATGGARGVTAALIETAVEGSSCSVILLGRTDPDTLPPELRDLDDGAFDARERAFYKQEMAQRSGVRIASLRERWDQYRAMREVRATLAELRARGRPVEYLRVDVTDATDVDSAVRHIVRKYRRIDLVLHGAAVQASRQLPRKKLEEFRLVVATKLGGLRHLRVACSRHLPGHLIHYHLITSAFSFFGNDGQPDYGAANQAMDRLVLSHAVAGVEQWSSIAWLGWASVGMTRGSEYAALARARGLRPILRDEGKSLFRAFLDRPATAGNIVQVSDGELRYYGINLTPSCVSLDKHTATLSESTWQISPSTYPFLRDHRTGGVPTLPGTFELELAARAALLFRPSRYVVSIEHAVFDRFVKVHEGATVDLRTNLRVIEESDHETIVEIALHSDFVHKSGTVLQRDIRHFSACVRLEDQPRSLPRSGIFADLGDGTAATDPYLAEDSPVKLTGLFRCLESIRLHRDQRSAIFRIADPTDLSIYESFKTPFLLLDAMTRCAVFNVEPDGTMQVWVPVSARRTLLPHGVSDASLQTAGIEARIRATAPRYDGELVFSDYVEAVDHGGRVIVLVEGLVAHRAGKVHV